MNESIHESQPRYRGGRGKAFALFGTFVLLGGAICLSQMPLATTPAVFADDPKSATLRAVESANAFLESIDAKQRERATFDFASDKKSAWSNLPVTMVPRNGVKLGELKKEQRDKAMAVVASVLSKEGYQKVVDIMDGDQKLTEGKGGKGKGGGKGPMFGTDLYYLAIFGTPSETKPWMVQFGGHHLGVNVTVIGKNFVLTPTHTGAQPTLFKRGDMEVRPLGKEIDAAFKLMAALDEKQRSKAILGDRPQGELLLGPGRDGKTIEPKGIKASELAADQQALLLDVIAAWVNIAESDAAAARMASIREKIADTYFAWNGPTEKGKAVYFRVQGPTVVIEYAPQGGTDHIHTVIRNPQDDYGAALLKR